MDPLESLRQHIEPFKQIYDNIGKSGKNKRRGFMKHAPVPFINNLRRIAKNTQIGNFTLNPESFKFFKQRRRLLAKAAGNKKQAIQAFRSQRGGSLATGLQQIVQSALQCPDQNHSLLPDPEVTSAQKHCKE